MKIKFILFFFFITWTIRSFSLPSFETEKNSMADVNSDSVQYWKKRISNSNSDKEKANLYSKIIQVYIETQPILALNYYFDAMCDNSSLIIADSQESITNLTLVMHSKYSSLEDSILKARIANFGDKEPRRNLGVYYYLLSYNANYRGLKETALKYCFKADAIFKEIGDPETERLTALILFQHFIRQGKPQQALAEVEKITRVKKNTIKEQIPWLKNYCMMIYFESLGNYDSLLYYALKAFDVAPTKYHKAFAHAEAGSAYLFLKQYDKAIEIFNKAKEENKSIGNSIEFNRYLSMIGAALSEKGEYKAAIDTLLLAVSGQSVVSDAEAYAITLNYLSDTYYKIGDYKKAYEYRLLLEGALDSVNSEQSRKNIADMQTKYETDIKDQEIEVQKNQLFRQQIINYGTAGVAILLVFFLAFVYRNYRQKQKANIELQEAKEKAEQSERFKQQFLANMSHEIRTPMNAVTGMTHLLIDKNPRPDQVNYLTGIKKSSDTLLHIINDILDISKIEAGKIELEQIDFSLRDVIDQVKQTLHHKADEKGLQLIVHIDREIPDVVVGDPVRLNQVLMNLAGNAIKFTEKGSVMIEARKAGSGIKFSIIDTGIGIPKNKIHSIFESFTQAHSSDTRKFGGTGLGLTISKQLVELMGGNISIESEEGSGSNFSFEIKYEAGSADRMRDLKSAESIDGSILNGLRILIADDNEHNRVVARDTLQLKAEVQITEAMNGKEALEIFRQSDFDIVLMDVQMPVMDGYEATRKIRETFSNPKNKVPVIALTASVIRSDLDKCKQAGMTDYVPKPFKVSQLISAIANATGREIKFISINNEAMPKKVIANTNYTDLSYLEEFCEGDKLRMKKYIDLFLDSASELIQNVNDAMKENNFEEIANQVHGFKIKWIMMGMNESRDLAQEIEIQCRMENVDYALIRKKIPGLLQQVQGAITELQGNIA